MTCLTTLLSWKWPGCLDLLALPLLIELWICINFILFYCKVLHRIVLKTSQVPHRRIERRKVIEHGVAVAVAVSRWARVYDASYWRLERPHSTAMRCLRQLHSCTPRPYVYWEQSTASASRVRSWRAVWNNWTRFIARALITRSFSTGATSRCQPQMYFRLNIQHRYVACYGVLPLRACISNEATRPTHPIKSHVSNRTVWKCTLPAFLKLYSTLLTI